MPSSKIIIDQYKGQQTIRHPTPSTEKEVDSVRCNAVGNEHGVQQNGSRCLDVIFTSPSPTLNCPKGQSD